MGISLKGTAFSPLVLLRAPILYVIIDDGKAFIRFWVAKAFYRLFGVSERRFMCGSNAYVCEGLNHSIDFAVGFSKAMSAIESIYIFQTVFISWFDFSEYVSDDQFAF